MATYIIGDIQGCYEPLQRLLAKIDFNQHRDRLWLAGDLINRGPDSLQVLRFLSQLPPHHQAVLGNHDLYFLSVALADQPIRRNDTLAELYAAPDRVELTHWLRQQPLALYAPEFNTLVVHAGVAPTWTLATTLALAHEAATQLQSEQGLSLLAQLADDQPDSWNPQLIGPARWRFIVNCLTRLRICDANGKIDLTFKRGLNQIPPDFMPWYQVPTRQTAGNRLVFGHWAALEGDVGDAVNIEAIDTGCVWGRQLTAYRLEDGVRTSVTYLNTADTPLTHIDLPLNGMHNL